MKKYLIFSDTHLTDQFDEKKFVFLKKIISSADQVIINGDFWDGYQISFDKFINSDWKKLFPLLKKKKTIYIYGNHDQKNFCDKRTMMFSVQQTERYILKTKKYHFVIEHGNKIYPFYDETTKIKTPFLIKILFKILEKTLIKTSGSFFFRFPLGIRLNKTMIKRFKKIYNHGEILICGHTHSAEFDLKKHLINTGFILHGLGHYLIIENEEPKLKKEKYD